jgi:hypothetical protein
MRVKTHVMLRYVDRQHTRLTYISAHPLSYETRKPTHSYLFKGWVWVTDTLTDILPEKCKMRSKVWWLTGFCNSHDVSHFAAFFIVVGTKTSVAEYVFNVGFHWKYSRWYGMGMKKTSRSKKEQAQSIAGIQTLRRTQKAEIYVLWQTLKSASCWGRVWKWSFRRFTYGNLVTTSPSSKWLGLNNFLMQGHPRASPRQSESFTESFNR